MGRAIGRRAVGGGLARAFDRLQRHAHLAFAARRAPALRPPGAADRGSESPCVRTRPRDRAAARCSTRLTDSTYSCQSSVAHRRRLVTAFATETCATPWRWCSPRIVSSAVVCRDARWSSTASANRRQPHAVFADAMEQLHDERRRRARRAAPRLPPRSSALRHVAVGGAARGARGQQFLGQAAQVLDERQLQHARPRPQLADRQRRDALVAVQELDQLLAIQPAVAVADQLDRDRVDAGLPGVLARGQRRQRARSRCAADCAGCR